MDEQYSKEFLSKYQNYCNDNINDNDNSGINIRKIDNLTMSGIHLDSKLNRKESTRALSMDATLGKLCNNFSKLNVYESRIVIRTRDELEMIYIS